MHNGRGAFSWLTIAPTGITLRSKHNYNFLDLRAEQT